MDERNRRFSVIDEELGQWSRDSSDEEIPTLVRRPVYEVRLEAFDGPLDLLLHLIREHEIDIYDIPIAQITGQYLEYLGLMESLDLVLAGDFLEMAATLIRIKVQMLLPSPAEDGEEEDPREQLVRQLVLYKKFKEAAGSLSGREDERRDFFPRGVDARAYEELVEDGVETEELLKDVSLFDLVDALSKVFSRIPRRIDVHDVTVETVTVEGEMERIRAVVSERGFVTFAGLFRPAARRGEIVTTFIALLELIRQNAVLAVQERIFGEITIRLIPEEQT